MKSISEGGFTVPGLPSNLAEGDKGALPPSSSASSRGQGELILVADDQDILLRTIKAILEHNGYKVLTARNGREAVDLVGAHTAEIALVILDVAMPVMSGGEALEMIREIAPQLPVMIASGYDLARTNLEFEGKSVAGFIHKPEPVLQLLAKIQSVLGASKQTGRQA